MVNNIGRIVHVSGTVKLYLGGRYRVHYTEMEKFTAGNNLTFGAIFSIMVVSYAIEIIKIFLSVW